MRCWLSSYGVVAEAKDLSDELKQAAQGEAYTLLYWGSVILGLGNGTVEAFINPVVATMFKKDKTKWLNILHAGWPGGLVLGGILTLTLGSQAAEDWRILIYLIAIPAIVYLVMLFPCKFPVQRTGLRRHFLQRDACGIRLFRSSSCWILDLSSARYGIQVG